MLLYDGDCSFCQSSVRLFHRLAKRPVEARPAASFPLEGADLERSRREVLFLTREGRLLGGVDAIAAALECAGRPGLAWLLRHAPFAGPVYRAIARNRGTLNCRATR